MGWEEESKLTTTVAFLQATRKVRPIINWFIPVVNYIGSDKEKFFYLENVDFDAKGTVKVDYLENELSGETTEEDFLKIFGNTVKRDFVKKSGGNSILLYSKGSDDGALFTFKDGRLVKLEYWTPC